MSETTKKVLIITYYWPPSGGAGVQRWLKFVKYLREYEWEPVVYTAANPEAPAEDTSLLKDIPEGIEVIKTNIWEPYSYYKKLVGMKAGEKISAGFLKEKKKNNLGELVSVWIRSNFFIPDARKFWIKPSIRFLSRYLQRHPVDAIISSGPPHSMHLIALGVKQLCSIPRIADFRDPWTGIDFYHQLKLTSGADKLHHKLEKQVLASADEVVVISHTMAEEFSAIVNRSYHLIPNGFDETDLKPLPLNQLDTDFSITHAGSITATRNPSVLWKVLSEKVKQDQLFASTLKIRLTGKIDYSVTEELTSYHLDRYLVATEYSPHSQVVEEMQKSQVLLLLINNTPTSKGIITGKLFEYLATGRPILAIGPPDGEAASILSSTNAGVTAGFEDEAAIRSVIDDYFIRFCEQRLWAENKGIEAFSRKNLTGKLSSLLDSLYSGGAKK